ncbi:hypothetical protein SAMN04488601_1011942 [Paenibacillus sp. 453mf]|nr:hypothetical protein SAMN04488601_1011942 [Paenibacillus sp. 453mf]
MLNVILILKNQQYLDHIEILLIFYFKRFLNKFRPKVNTERFLPLLVESLDDE